MSEYRFATRFKDGQRMRCVEIAQPVTQYSDVEYVRDMLARVKEKYPQFAKYIVDTSRLIVEAAESDATDAHPA